MKPDHERPIVLAAGVRSPMARAGGRFRAEDAGHLGAQVARELFSRTGLLPEQIDQVIVGCAGPPHDQANIGRVIGLRAGVPERVPGFTVARNCASGMEAVTNAATCIRAGEAEVVLAMGVEVMSAFPLMFGKKMTNLFAKLNSARTLPKRLKAISAFRPSFLAPRVAIMEGLTDPVSGLIMGKTAELLARDFDVTREEADQYAAESHARAKRARDAGRFVPELEAHLPLGARPGDTALDHDDSIRDDQTVEKLAKLRPYFEK
ncbi:MAG: beta-ketoacyl synthase N-terminal-like domain-containing protein, partial [Planctomycetota bacterium]